MSQFTCIVAFNDFDYSISLCYHNTFNLRVVIQLNGDGISSAQAQELANLLSDQSSSLTLEIVEVTVSDSGSDDDGEILSSPAVIGIAVGASVVGLVLILLLSAILVACIVNRNRRIHRQDKYR